MKRIISFVLMFVIVSLNTVTAANIKQNHENEVGKEPKVIWVSGIVTDEQGDRLSGVLIMVVRESESEMPFGVESGENGKYRIRLLSNKELFFSLNGYESQIVSINGRDEIDIVMKKPKK